MFNARRSGLAETRDVRRRLSGVRLVALGAVLAGVVCLGTVVPAAASSRAHAVSASAIESPHSTATGLGLVPAGARPNYKNYQQYAWLFPDAYSKWTPPKGKVKFCTSTFYLGNTYQQGFAASIKQLVNDEVAAGVASRSYEILNSNNSTATQISQLQSEINSGCNVIIAEPSSATAFCPTFKTAFDKGILVISDQPVNCNYEITVSFDVYENSYELAAHLYKAMNYKGNIIEITGVPGVADATTATTAANNALKGHPGIKVVGVYTGDWTASIAQTATAEWLSTHPETVNGIIDEGAMGVAAETAFQQAGRALPKVSLQEGDCQELAFQKAHPSLVPYMTDQAPAPAAYVTMNVALRMLAGERPALDTILYPIPGPTKATFNQWYKPGMTVSSSCFASPKPALPALSAYLPQFFTGGKAVTKFPQPS